MATSKIRRLPEPIVSQIAAGEVVERPASIVKELLENALDAGASFVTVSLEQGGRRLIKVQDDGSGMSAEDAVLAFEPHATSKIEHFEDLERIGSYGFRGEALASIAAVADVEMRTAESVGDGFRVMVSKGEVIRKEPVATTQGTTVIVRDLFSHVPARRAFLKIPSAEMRRCLEVVQGYALALPQVRFRLDHDGRNRLDTAVCSDDDEGRLERIAQVFGVTLASELIALPRRPGVSGFVGTPATAKGRRIFLFINRRLIKDRALLAAFYRTVRDEWKIERFPALFLFLDLPPEEVDVNVHPQKAEVRFKDRRIVGRVVNCLKSALMEGRGAVDAPVRAAEQVPDRGLAWGPPSQDAGEVAEPFSDGEPARTHPSLLEGSGETRLPGFNPRLGESDALEVPDVGAKGRGAKPVPLSRGSEGRPLRLLGQYKGSLLLLEGEDGLYLIDQHAAHERILYERFRRAALEGRVSSQRLLSPQLLELSSAEATSLDAAGQALERLGFEIRQMSRKTVGVTAVPSFLDVADAERILLELAGRLGEHEGDLEEVSAVRQELLESLAADSACKAAVKIHHRLDQTQMESLVGELFEAEQPYSCPHGRPTVLRMGDAELERRFGRR